MTSPCQPLPAEIESPKASARRRPRAGAAAEVVTLHADAAVREDVDAACALIPPLWTLRNFVAVNPYLGLSDVGFLEAAGVVDRVFHGRALMDAAFYRERHATGRISDDDLRAAAQEAARELARPELAGLEPDALLAALAVDATATGDGARVRCLADIVDRETGSGFGALAVDEISRWCAARFDLGQASWKQPWRSLPTFAAWREAASIDRSCELRGLRGFRRYAASLPPKPLDAIAHVLAQLAIPAEQRADYLARLLASIAGWAGHAQYRAREAARAGASDDALYALLAIRIAFEGALDRVLDPSVAEAARAELRGTNAPAQAPTEANATNSGDVHVVRYVWQLAFEHAYRKGLLGSLHRTAAAPVARAERAALDAVFCIDVRSEVLRRHLEKSLPCIRTRGFAGFFGMPIEYVEPGNARGSDRCPVLIAPPHRIRASGDAAAEDALDLARSRHEQFLALRKQSVGAFPLVETAGWLFGLRLVTDALGWTRPHEGGALFASRARSALAPAIDAEEADGETFGLSLEARVDLAEGALRNMGMTGDFAEVVLLCGHGSSSTNNPYASGLDCGACGGHAGDVNARVASAILASPHVRAGLAERGIQIPEDTRFVAALHDTTRDEVALLDAEKLAPEERARIESWLEDACEQARNERSVRLGERPGRGLARRLAHRARDWSEVRPEWALAGNAAFIAARREHTRGLDLGGRSFLHDYDPDADTEGAVLELILSAPLVVASWINLQYYGSTVDNDVFGSGNKVLHNVVGRHGVMLGNRSDLRPGLPWQSVHDGCGYVHEPMRLTAVVEAPRPRIDAVLAAHPEVCELVENGWLRLVAWDPARGAFHRRSAHGWEEVELPASA